MALELVPEEDDKDHVEKTEKQQAGEAPAYTGPERRTQQRRQTVDRREMVRFEEKTDRRSRQDRRRPQGLWKDRDF
ncbi:hypothetical protein MNBD_GAMMA20-1499 [hydrothermal vent metagenome]|uniref:Uncharacterized protein n=1 Tax=hydrothermal vent metagenome TaxID=652676 RepID=A0A3B1AEK7_9ZZZZ